MSALQEHTLLLSELCRVSCDECICATCSLKEQIEHLHLENYCEVGFSFYDDRDLLLFREYTKVARKLKYFIKVCDDAEENRVLYIFLKAEYRPSLAVRNNGSVYQMFDYLTKKPIKFCTARHNYTNHDLASLSVGHSNTFLPMFGNNNPVASIVTRIM